MTPKPSVPKRHLTRWAQISHMKISWNRILNILILEIFFTAGAVLGRYRKGEWGTIYQILYHIISRLQKMFQVVAPTAPADSWCEILFRVGWQANFDKLSWAMACPAWQQIRIIDKIACKPWENVPEIICKTGVLMRFSKLNVKIAVKGLNFSRTKLTEIVRSAKKQLLMTAMTMAAVNGVFLHRLIRGTFARTSKDPKIDFTGTIYDFASSFAINSQRKNF